MPPSVGAIARKKAGVLTLGFLAWAISSFFILVQARAGSSGLDHYAPDMRRILERGKLVVAMVRNDNPPFFMKDHDGRLKGFDVSLAEEIARNLGVEVEFNRSPSSFEETVRTLAAHQADLALSNLTITLKRAELVRFTRPYLVLHPTLVVNRLIVSDYSFPRQDPLRELGATDRNIGVTKGTSYVPFARIHFPRARIAEYWDWDAVMAAVLRGQVIAGVSDEIGVKHYLAQNPELAIRLKMVVMDGFEDRMAIAVPSDSLQLLAWLNLFLEQNYQRTTADQLLEKLDLADGAFLSP